MSWRCKSAGRGLVGLELLSPTPLRTKEAIMREADCGVWPSFHSPVGFLTTPFAATFPSSSFHLACTSQTPSSPKQPKPCCKARAVLPIHNTHLKIVSAERFSKLFSLLPFDTPQNNNIVTFFFGGDGTISYPSVSLVRRYILILHPQSSCRNSWG